MTNGELAFGLERLAESADRDAAAQLREAARRFRMEQSGCSTAGCWNRRPHAKYECVVAPQREPLRSTEDGPERLRRLLWSIGATGYWPSNSEWLEILQHACRIEATLDHSTGGTDKIADFVAGLAAHYPPDIFTPEGKTPDGIAGTTLREMLPRIAERIRSGEWLDEA